MRRISGKHPPWTDDPVLVGYRFTNVYRAADRVSQYLIRHVIYEGEQSPEEIFFRTLLFKLFNRIETWEELTKSLGFLSWKTFKLERYDCVLNSMLAAGEILYSGAYIMPSPPFENRRKHRNHLQLLEFMMHGRAPKLVMRAKSLENVFQVMLRYPSIGNFLGFQFAIDLNYSNMVNFSEMDFVIAGPGARDGIKKCFADTGGYSESDIIRIVCDIADDEFQRLNLNFQSLWGRKLQLIDCQNLFCEVDKYSRVVHPEFSRLTSRTRIKQRFLPRTTPLFQWYPPKWKLIPDRYLSREIGATSQDELLNAAK